jgi:hypothetical protein
LKWSETERRFNGTWREGEDRFGELSLRLVDDEMRGAHTTNPQSKITHARPRLADVTWIRAAAMLVPPRGSAKVAPAQPLDLTGSYQTPASQFDRITTFPWRAVPRGSQTLGNVPLAIDGMLCLWGEGNAKRGLVFPETVDDIPVNRTFDTLIDRSGLDEGELRGLHPGDDHRAGRPAQSRKTQRQVTPNSLRWPNALASYRC